MGTTSSAKDELSELLGDRNIFSTPKPMKLFKELIRASTSTDSIILDCYAGSGTTGHSTMDLNKEDGGQREFILITNNESDICNMVTIPRIKNAICKNDFNVDLKIIKL
jgi:adenine-specific DNA-methyltransferase